MALKQFVRSQFTQLLTGPTNRAISHRLADWRRRFGNNEYCIEYFHQVDDPYSHLAAQVLPKLAETYQVELKTWLVGPPDDASAPERELLMKYARKDAADIAPHYGLTFPGDAKQPPLGQTHMAQRLLASRLDLPEFADFSVLLGNELWVGHLDDFTRQHRPADEHVVEAELAAGNARRQRLGHYLGGMFYFLGEWYWGVDRLLHLESRLRKMNLLASADLAPIAPRPKPTPPAVIHGDGITLEYFPSLRSPYTAISMKRVYDLVDRTGVELVLRPVLPMVMRNVPVPLKKGLYIMRDTWREAELINAPFGNMCDPVGRPVERAYSLFDWARQQGKAREFLLAFARAAFAEGIDTGSDKGMQYVLNNAGLSWNDAANIIDNEDWREEIEQNRLAMYDAGVWGVPSFRVSGPDTDTPALATWGQDRIWLVEASIYARMEKS